LSILFRLSRRIKIVVICWEILPLSRLLCLEMTIVLTCWEILTSNVLKSTFFWSRLWTLMSRRGLLISLEIHHSIIILSSQFWGKSLILRIKDYMISFALVYEASKMASTSNQCIWKPFWFTSYFINVLEL
jgi:hypothetical protein